MPMALPITAAYCVTRWLWPAVCWSRASMVVTAARNAVNSSIVASSGSYLAGFHNALRVGSLLCLTGALVAVARVAGETAPLLFTAFGNQFWSLSPTQPIAALPLQIFNDVGQPQDRLVERAWGAALTLILKVFALPWILHRLIIRLNIKWDVETLINQNPDAFPKAPAPKKAAASKPSAPPSAPPRATSSAYSCRLARLPASAP